MRASQHLVNFALGEVRRAWIERGWVGQGLTSGLAFLRGSRNIASNDT